MFALSFGCIIKYGLMKSSLTNSDLGTKVQGFLLMNDTKIKKRIEDNKHNLFGVIRDFLHKQSIVFSVSIFLAILPYCTK